jgi:hypothetical protein
MPPGPVVSNPRFAMSKKRSADLFWMFGAPIGLVALLFAFGAHL